MKRSGFPRRSDTFKKPRVQQNNFVETTPSRVLHVRGLDESITPADIVKFAIPFGRVKNLVYAKAKRQALMELEELSAATEIVKHYEKYPPGSRNSTYYIQFSKHEALDNEQSSQNQNIMEAIRHANRMRENNLHNHGGSGNNGGNAGSGNEDKHGAILRIYIDDMQHPVKIDSIHSIFSRYGGVNKIVTYTKNDRFGALIEMENAICAQAAMTNLDGKHVYNGCCVLSICIAPMNQLVLRYNNEKSRDYTNPHLPPGDEDFSYEERDGLIDGGFKHGNGSQGMGQMAPMGGPPANSQIFNQGLGLNQNIGGIDLNQALSGATLNPTLNQALGLLVANSGLSILNQLQAAPTLTNLLGSALPNPLAAAMANTGPINFYDRGRMRDDDQRRGNWGDHNRSADRGSSRDFDKGRDAGRGDYEKRGRGQMEERNRGSGKILYVTRLNAEKVTTDILFVLFGLYGNVMRVKILYNHKDMALVELENEEQTKCAHENLRNVELYGSRINVDFSKYEHIPMLKDNVDEPWLTKDYSNSPFHRFRISNSKNHHNIYPPSSKLHLSNIPSVSCEELLKSKFSNYGEIRNFEFNSKDQRMAWVQYDSTSTAVEALVELNNMELDSTHHLRVSFAPMKNRRYN